MFLFHAFTELKHLMHFRRQSSTFQPLRPTIICTKQAHGKSEFCRQQLPEDGEQKSTGLQLDYTLHRSLGCLWVAVSCSWKDCSGAWVMKFCLISPLGRLEDASWSPARGQSQWAGAGWWSRRTWRGWRRWRGPP